MTELVDEPPPAIGTEESIEEDELPNGEPDDEEGEDWDDPDDDTPKLEGQCRSLTRPSSYPVRSG